MSARSPILGFNHNFKHRGLIFHVQTEDSGVSNPHIFTHLFHGGVILSSRKLDYDAEAAEEVVKALMQSQHKAVLKDLKAGSFDDKIDEYLGDHEDLRPRRPPSATPEASSRGATTERVAAPDFASIPQPTADNVDVTVPMSVPPKHEVGNQPSLAQATERAPTGKPGVATVFGPGPGNRPSIPTPIAVPVQDGLGDPVVTFSSANAPANVPTPIPHEGSGSYSKVRRKPTQPPPPQAPAAQRAAGKAANPPPGRPRSSVVVSRPAVIIGGPPKVVGGNGRDAGRTGRRARAEGPGIFGKDLISEKSLDEVILAYLSEDGEE